MDSGDIAVALRDVQKHYHALRPLRIQRLELREGDSVALLGLDAPAAEVLVGLITGALLPDEGQVDVFGSSTRTIDAADTWVQALDRFGLVSERAVLLDPLTVEQNLALPLSLELDRIPGDVRERVRGLAQEVGLTDEELARAASEVSPTARVRLRLGKALALTPRVLLAEHPTAGLPAPEAPAFAALLSAIASRRRLAMLVITADRAFARASSEQVLTLRPATGELIVERGWRAWFRS